MSAREVVESQIRTARICRERYATMSEVEWLAGGIVFVLKHSMSVIADGCRFAQTADAYLQELSTANQHEAAAKVSSWLDAQHT